MIKSLAKLLYFQVENGIKITNIVRAAMSEFVMPYGKFKGKAMYEIPSGYLRWLAENVDDDTIACEADEEYQHRERYNCHWYED